MIEFALKLTSTPSSMSRDDIDGLKQHGFSEEHVVDIVLITCMFNFMDRLADGLGVELDPDMQAIVDRYARRG